MKHGAGGPKHSEEVSANQLLLRALAGQSPGAITPASSESLSRREEEEEEEEEKEGERKPRATPKEEREVAAGSGHCRDGWTLPVGQILGRRTQPTDTHKFRAPRPGRRVLSQSHFLPRTADRKGFVQKHPNNKTKQNKAKQNKKHPCVLTFKIQIYYANSF
ncbi:uncharacterized protein LOC134148452 isoform X17 [Rhea pennata]|uniref:uncharacterized protein LOC134148452 isoform X17 n=1 Tax=Rhea pennata TaxID=8795 RepID=UPI002E2640B3